MTWFAGCLALWTISSQIAVVLGASLLQLLACTAVLFLGLGVVSAQARGKGLLDRIWPSGPEDLDASADATDDDRFGGDLPTLHKFGLLVAVVTAVLGTSSFPLVQWWTITACLLIGWFVGRRTSVVAVECAPTLRQELCLWGLSLGCAVFALLVHRPDADDSFYVNLAASAIDRPELPLLARDTLHGLASAGLHNPVYKFHSWELANAAVGLLAGVSALATFHVLATAFVACLVPMAWAVLLRRLAPRTWMPTLVSLLFLFLVVGETHRWYGNFTFVRIWQGKAVFLSVLLPLLWAWGLRLADRPSWRSALWTLAGLVGSVGTTSSALWAGPAAVGAAVPVMLQRRNLRRVVVLLLMATLYSAGIGLGLKHALASMAQRAVAAAEQPGILLPNSLGIVLGDGPFSLICLVALAGAWTVAPAGPGRRFAAVAAFLPWVTILNPFAESLVAGHVTGPAYWRALWLLPIPLLVAFLLSAPWTLAERRPRLALVGWLAGILLLLASVGTFSWSTANSGASFRLAPYKLPAEVRPGIGLLAEAVPYGAVVVAPRDIANWVAVLQDGVHPVSVRDYLPIKGYPRRDRLLMTRLAGGRMRQRAALEAFRTGLWRYRVEAVLFYTKPQRDMVRATLRSAAFEPAIETDDWELWLRRGLDPAGDRVPSHPIMWR